MHMNSESLRQKSTNSTHIRARMVQWHSESEGCDVVYLLEQMHARISVEKDDIAKVNFVKNKKNQDSLFAD